MRKMNFLLPVIAKGGLKRFLIHRSRNFGWALDLRKRSLSSANLNSGRKYEITHNEQNFMRKNFTFLRNCAAYKQTVFNADNFNPLDVLKNQNLVESKAIHVMLRELKSATFKFEYFYNVLCCIGAIGERAKTTEKKSTLEFGLGKIKHLTDEQLINLLKLFVKFPFLRDELFLQEVDRECAKRSSDWDGPSCLVALDLMFLILSEKICMTDYWMVLLANWEEKIDDCSLQQIIQLLFYLSLQKDAPKSLLAKMESVLEKSAETISLEELHIICRTFFKNRHQVISERLLQKIADHLQMLLKITKVDTFAVISCCKALRQARYFNSNICQDLAARLKDGLLKTLNLTETVHLMATLANLRFYDEHLYREVEVHGKNLLEVENSAVQNLPERTNVKKWHPTFKSRPKDVAKLLWIFAETGHSFKDDDLVRVVMQNIRFSFRNKLFNNEPHALLDCLVSLAVLNHYPKDLISACFTDNYIEQIKASRKAKPLKQLFMLEHSLSLEMDNCSSLDKFEFHSSVRDIGKELALRPQLQKLRNLFETLNSRHQFSCTRLLPYIPISGILTYTDELGNLADSERRPPHPDVFKTAIEVLDSTVCLRDTTVPCGFLKMKCRQLNRLGYKVVQIPSFQLDNLKKGDSEQFLILLKNAFKIT